MSRRHHHHHHQIPTIDSLDLPPVEILTELPPSPIVSPPPPPPPVDDGRLKLPSEQDEAEVSAPAKRPSPAPPAGLGLWRRYLYRVHQYSTYPFSAFLLLHFTTAIATPALTTSIDAGDNAIVLARVVYHSPLLEPVLVFAPLAVHVTSGLILRLHKIFRDRKWYAKRTKLSRVSFSGVLLLPLVAAHVVACRVAPLAVDGDSASISLRYIARGLDRMPGGALTGLLLYSALVGLASYHVCYGWAKWLRWPRRKMMYVHAAAASSFVVGVLGLRVVARGAADVPLWAAAKYDEMYDFVEGLLGLRV
ncbi:hypothetical protein BZA70DRAFT_167754 [Myxozyma melibiosi]|uniref:Mitochondrial adapter protein MCP1 transmembrane domain-containing protein n=1 Tax=Myxozyma melibiosi TaxID=54550 RepID=A0ABR1F7A3_9ASCO